VNNFQDLISYAYARSDPQHPNYYKYKKINEDIDFVEDIWDGDKMKELLKQKSYGDIPVAVGIDGVTLFKQPRLSLWDSNCWNQPIVSTSRKIQR
jgi:hypothetical protein